MVLFIFLIIFLVFMNGFFVAAEFAIVKVRASQLELRIQKGDRFAILAKHIISHLDGYLASTQLGITLASLGLGWIGEPVVAQMILKFMSLIGVSISPEIAHGIALPTAFAIITILHIVFGELMPKSIAIQLTERTTLIIAYPLQFFYYVFKPFTFVLNGLANLFLKIIGVRPSYGAEIHSNDELRYLVQQGKESGVIEEPDYHIIKNAFDFSKRTIKQVLVPRTQVRAIDINDYDDSVLDRIIEEGYSRIPIYRDNLDNIIGVVYLKDILLKMRKNQKVNLGEIMRPVLIVPETKRIKQLLRDFQSRHQQIAVVTDEYGGTNGIITMEDILEELVGEIQDEYDDETPFVEKTGEKKFAVLASASLDDINELLPHPISTDEQYETLAGCLIMKFGRIPNTNDKISFDDYEFTILKKSRSTIILVQLRDLEEDKEE